MNCDQNQRLIALIVITLSGFHYITVHTCTHGNFKKTMDILDK